jgi:hypothetical protein
MITTVNTAATGVFPASHSKLPASLRASERAEAGTSVRLIAAPARFLAELIRQPGSADIEDGFCRPTEPRRFLRVQRPETGTTVLWSPSYVADSCYAAPISMLEQYGEQ